MEKEDVRGVRWKKRRKALMSKLTDFFDVQPSMYRGWTITQIKGIHGGCSATKGFEDTELFWEPDALENIKRHIDFLEDLRSNE